MNRRDLEFQLQCLFEGSLDQQALLELERELNDNPEARDAYIDYAHLHNALELRAEGIDLLHVVPMDRANSRSQRRFFQIALIAAAAALVMLASVLWIISAPSPILTFATSPGAEVVVSHDLSEGETPRGASMEPGSRLEIRRGTVEVTFASGIRGIIRGPADLTLHSPGLLHLAHGTAWFEVPPEAIGFQVSTPELILTDLGTEFGILSNRDYPHEVHVFAGKVEVATLNGVRKEELLEAGEARVAEPSGEWRSIPLDAKPFLKELPETEVLVHKPKVVVTEQIGGDQFAFQDTASASDLLHGLKPDITGWNLKNDAHPDELTDGIHGAGFNVAPDDKVQGAWTTVGATVTYHLGLGSNGLGYDLTSIQSIAAWDSAGFGNQTWSIEVKAVNGEFTHLAEVSFRPFEAEPLDGGGSSLVILSGESGELARHIEAIRFTAGRVSNSVNGAFVWRELDVFGTPTVAGSQR